MSCLIKLQDVRDFLEGYCALNNTSVYAITGTTVQDSAIITAIADTSNLRPEMKVSGTGIPVGSRILTVDSTSQITLDSPASADGTAVALTVTYYSILSDYWLCKQIESFIIPFVESRTGQSFFKEESAVEYHSGNGKNVLILDRRPIVRVTDVRYVLGGNNFSILNLAMIEVVAKEGILKSKTNYDEAFLLPMFAKGDYNIKVTYDYGYTTTPEDIYQAMIYLTAEKALGHVAGRTGGGNPGSQVPKSFKERGMFTEVRNDLARQAMSIIQNYMTSVVGN